MGIGIYVAACLAVVTALAHSYLGERYILTRLFRRPDLPQLFGGTEFTTRTLRFAWHITTVAWLGFAAILVLLARDSASPANLLLVIGVTSVASALLTLVISRARHLAWLAFLAIGCIALYAGAA